MAERYAYLIHAAPEPAVCGHWGCADPAAYEAVYRFQHDGDAFATERRWLYCMRHGPQWAQVHGVPCPEVPRPDQAPPLPMATQPHLKRRLMGGVRKEL